MAKATEMGIALAAGALASAFLNLDKLQKFKGAGIEVELKEVVKEAYATIEHLKVISEPLIISSTKSITWGNRWSGISEEDQHKMISYFREVSEKIHLNSSEVHQAFEEFYKLNLKDYFIKLQENVRGYNQADVEKKLAGLIDFEESIFPSEKQIRNLLSDYDINIKLSTEEVLKDYIYYKENRYPRSRS
jgi:hypothetical protein